MTPFPSSSTKCCDVVLLLDIKLRMHHFGIGGEDGVPVLKQEEFGDAYRKGRFKWHVAASVPFDYLVYTFSVNYKYVALAKVNRFLRIGHFFGVLEKLDSVVSVRNESLVKVCCGETRNPKPETRHPKPETRT